MTDGVRPDPILLTVESRAHGWRVDHYLTRIFPNHSRAQLQHAIEEQTVLVNDSPVKSSRRLRAHDRISVQLPDQAANSLPAEDIPLNILFEDDSLVIINKPAGMIVHPGKGNYSGTLAGALQGHFNRLSDIAGLHRPGIVHRLDRDTSGVLVVAKDNQIHHKLSAQFEQREVVKVYRAITHGTIELDSDFIETYVRVHPKSREKMCISAPGGNARHAVTFYQVIERLGRFTYVELRPKTGRTHQLRVHMQYLVHPILADRVYGGGGAFHLSDLTKHSPPETERAGSDDSDLLIDRQALHAFQLGFRHPKSGEWMEFEAPLPEDIERTLTALKLKQQEAQ